MTDHWHNKPETKTMLQTFHRKHARYPTPRIRKAKKRFTVYTNYLASKLRARGMCSRIGYTGSVYQDVVVPFHNMDFDIVVIQPKDISRCLTPVPIPGSPGYCNLKMDLSSLDIETADKYRHLLDDNGYLLPVNSIDKFFGVVQEVINDHGEMSQVVELVRSGPSVQLDTYRMGCRTMKKKKTKEHIMYSVDVVLAYEIEHAGQKTVYVAKPPKTGSSPTSNAWRMSFSLNEKELFDGMGGNNSCRKMVLRILKAMLKNQPELKGLTSYNFKTALLHEVKETSKWRDRELVPRLMGVIDRLCRNLEAGFQPDYFVPEINVLAKLTSEAMENTSDRLRRIMHSESVFRDIFT